MKTTNVSRISEPEWNTHGMLWCKAGHELAADARALHIGGGEDATAHGGNRRKVLGSRRCSFASLPDLTLGIRRERLRHLRRWLRRVADFSPDQKTWSSSVLVLGALAMLTVVVSGQTMTPAPTPAQSASDVVARHLHDPMTITPEILVQLAREYRTAGLPLPPAGARPSKIEFAGAREEGDTGTSVYILGFRLAPGSYLVGTEIRQDFTDDPPGSPSDAVDPEQPPTVALADAAVLSHRLRSEGLPVNRWLAIAVQCEIQGFHTLARQIFERGLPRDPAPVEWDQFVQEFAWPVPGAIHAAAAQARAEDGGDPHLLLAATAWNHWINFTTQTGTDRREALAHLDALARDFPALDGPAQHDFREALRLTVQPGKGAPGSAEALIDGLTDLYHDEPESFRKRRENFPDYVQLSQMGFAAMPALIAHMDDLRLTRVQRTAPTDQPYMRAYLEKQGCGRVNPGPEVMLRVGDLISPLVYRLVGPTGIRRSFQEGASRQELKRQAEQWWAETSKQSSEEEYVVSRVLPIEGVQRSVNRTYLETVGARYPQRLQGIYEDLLKQPRQIDEEAIVQAIVANESLSKDDKRLLLGHGADAPNLWRREDAIVGLFKVDPADADARLIRELDRLPTTLDDQGVRSPMVQLAPVVRWSDAPRVWAAFERAARRADVALRLELLDRMGSGVSVSGLPRRTQARIKLLAAFLDDETVRVMPSASPKAEPGRSQFDRDAPASLFHRPQFTVGDFAASRLPSLLEIIGQAREDFTAEDWTRFRQQVRTATKDRAESQRRGLYPPDKD